MRKASKRVTDWRSTGNALGLIVGVEEDVQAGELADGLVDDLGVFDGLEGDGLVRDGLKLDRAGDGVDGAEGFGLVGGLLEGRGLGGWGVRRAAEACCPDAG